MKRVFAGLMALVMSLSVLAGCGQGAASQGAASQSPGQSAPGAGLDPAFPITVTDQAGRSVTLDAPAQTIVSGYYISSSACIALGLEDRLVGIETGADQRPIYRLAAPELIDTAVDVGSAKSFDLEACATADPDLVILPKKAQDYAAALDELGILSIVVSPESHRELTDMIGLIAALTGSTHRAVALTARYDQLLSQIQALTDGLSDGDKPTVYLCSTGTYLSTAPRDMYQADLIRSAGGINAGDVLEGDRWTEVSYEQLLAMDPDVIVIPTNSFANGAPDFSAQDLLDDPQLAQMKAVKAGAIYQMPAGLEAWDSPVPSGVLGMLWMLSTLHPDLCSPDQLADAASSFYADFYGFQLDVSLLKAA